MSFGFRKILAVIFCIGIFISLSGCVTQELIAKTKKDRKNEAVSDILFSGKDADGKLTIVYRKKDRQLYKVAFAFDSVVNIYENSNKIFWSNPDATANLKSISYTDDVNNGKGYYRIILFDREILLTSSDSSLISKPDQHAAEPLRLRLTLHEDEANQSVSKPVAFLVKPDLTPGYDIKSPRTFIVAFSPKRKKNWRYALVPITAIADLVTLPVQLLLLAAYPEP